MSNDKITLEAYTLEIPSFNELWDDVKDGALKSGANKSEIKVAAVCAFDVYSGFLDSIRKQLSREN